MARRILYQLGGIQSVSALPRHLTFRQTDNKYDIPSYNRICVEFRVELTADFRFTHGANHGLGNVSRYGPTSTGTVYPSSNVKFSGEGGIPNLGTLVAFTRNDNNTERQFDWFVPNKANGITQAGRSRLSQSIEAFLYCILLGPRLMCEAAFFAMEAERKKRRASFSLCWSTLSGSQTWPTACSASSWLLQSKGETWSCGGNERTKGRKSGRLSLPMTRMLRFLLFLSFNCYPPLLIAVILRWLIFWLHQ